VEIGLFANRCDRQPRRPTCDLMLAAIEHRFGELWAKFGDGMKDKAEDREVLEEPSPAFPDAVEPPQD
jgi:hypothetical protein